VVSDNGIGMSEELMARVFEPFQQAPQSLARRTGGLGLGLAIVRKIVELHHGEVTVYTRAPAQAAALKSHCRCPQRLRRNPAPSPRRMSKGCNCCWLMTMWTPPAPAPLHGNCWERCAAHNAAVLDAVRQKMPQVAILDIGLPDMDEATPRRGHPPSGLAIRLCVGALTGYGQKEDITRALRSGLRPAPDQAGHRADLQRATAPLT
jgi:hypothetical protein